MKFAAAPVFFLFLSAALAPLCAQSPEILSRPDPDSPIGVRNPNAPGGLAQFDFLIGDWDADITYYPPQGEPMRYRAKWHNIWIVNGTVVYQEWRDPYTTGGEFRYFDPTANNWPGYNVYPGRGWTQTLSSWNPDTAEMTVRSHPTGPRGVHINEEIYYDIAPDSFKIRSRKSFDDGESWERGIYELTAMRAS